MVEVTTFFKESLPPEFKLQEDPHFIFLFFGEKLIAVFPSTSAEPLKIKEEAIHFIQKLRVEAFCSKS
jgi:hypothetical protein